MKKALKIAIILIALIFVGIQFIRPERTNPPVDESQTIQTRLDVPAEIDSIFSRACNDCHSNSTNWIWYSNIAPISWYMTQHVEEGRRELNFSEWGKYEPDAASRKLRGICVEVESGTMPLSEYVLLHRSAKLSEEDKKLLCDWVDSEREKLRGIISQTP